MTRLTPRVTRLSAALGFLLALVAASAAPAQVCVTAEAEKVSVAPGGRLGVAVILDFDDHFHAWPADVEVLPESIRPTATPTRITASGPGLTVGPIQWPGLTLAPVPDFTTGGPIDALVLQGRAIAYIPVLVAPDAEGEVRLAIAVSYQACDETICLPPATSRVQVVVRVGEDQDAPAGRTLFANFDRAVFDTMSHGDAQSSGDPPVEDDPDADDPNAEDPDAAQAPEPASPRGGRFLGIIDVPRASGVVGLLIVGLLAIVGGAVLNLTPCVLPVLPIKMMALSKHAGTPGRALALGLWMAAGVVAFWLSLAVPVLAIRGFADPSRIFGYWWVTLGIGLIIALMGLGIMGLFQIRLPQAVYALNPRADSAWGSFLFGVMAGVLGLPCFGFVAGGLLAGTTTLSATNIIVIFLGLGVGMASPYLLLAARPGLIEKIPRTGPASELVKQVMGLLLIAAASFFIAVGLRTLILDYPWLSKTLHWWVVAFFVALGAGWMALRTFQITRSGAKRAVFGALALGVTVGFLWFADATTTLAREEFLRLEAAAGDGGAEAVVTDAWVEYTPARLERALAAGKVVVVDFTATWCANCKFLKATVLDREPLRTRLLADDVVMLEADLTSIRAPGNAKLAELGQSGIPLLVVYTPGERDPFWLANAYTGSQVVEVLDRAAARAAGAAGSALAGSGGG